MDVVTKRRLLLILKWTCHLMLLLAFYVISETPQMFSIGGIKPVLVIPAAIMLSVFEGELGGALCGALCGLLMEMGSNRPVGSLALMMLLLCMIVGLLFIYAVRLSWLTATLSVAAVASIIGLADYLFVYVLGNLEQGGIIFMTATLPVIAYTTAVAPLMFWLYGNVSGFFRKRLEE